MEGQRVEGRRVEGRRVGGRRVGGRRVEGRRVEGQRVGQEDDKEDWKAMGWGWGRRRCLERLYRGDLGCVY